MLDNSLIQSVLEKKHGAFTIFYNEIVDHFYSYLKANFSISETEIQDIISNTFIKIWNNLDSFDSEKWNFTSWIWTILRNTTKDFFKKRNEYVFSDFEYTNNDWETIKLEDSIEDEANYIDTLETDYQYDKIQKAISWLKIDEKEILFLRFTEQKSLKEIAEIIWISEWNVRVKLHRVIAKLKKYLN